MKKIITLLALAFIVNTSSAQLNNMITEIPFGQSVNTVLADGNDLWFGTMYGVVKYNKITQARTYFTSFNTPLFIDSAYYKAGVMAIVKDTTGNIYASIGRTLLKYDGTTWSAVYRYNYDIVDMYVTSENIIRIRIVHYLYGSRYELHRYNPVTGTDQLISDYSINGGGEELNYDGSDWTWTAYGTDSLKLTRKIDTTTIQRLYISAINSVSGNHFTMNKMYTSQYGKSVFLMKETNGSVWLGVIDSGQINYFPIPYENTNLYLRSIKHAFASNGDFSLLFYVDGLYEKIVRFTIDKVYVLTFNGSQVHILDSSDIGTNYFNIKDLTYDDDNNLWLTNSFVNDRLFSKNVFKQDSTGQWSGLNVNEVNIPGYQTFSDMFIQQQAKDGNGTMYLLYNNAITIVDTLMNITTYQIENTVNLVLGTRMSVSKGGHLWIGYSSDSIMKFKHYYQGTMTVFPSSIPYRYTTYTFETQLLATDSGMYFRPDSAIHFFDGTTWSRVLYSSSNKELLGYDYVHKDLYFSSRTTWYPYVTTLVKYDGASFIADTLSFPQVHRSADPHNITIDEFGNKWFLMDDSTTANIDYQLYELKYNGTLVPHFINPNYKIKGAFVYGTKPEYSYSNRSIFLKGYHYPANGDIYLLKFDTSWSPYIIDTVMFGAMDHTYWGITPAFWSFGDHNLLRVDESELIIDYTDGIINLPGTNYNVVHGRVFYDLNGDSIFNNNDIPAYTSAVTSGTFSTLVDANGNYTLHTDSGFQTIDVNLPASVNVSPVNYTYNFGSSNGNQIFNRDFAIQPTPGVVDLSIDLTNNRFRPGFNSQYYLIYKNLGYVVSNATVKLIFNDPFCSFVSAVPAPTAISGDTITWRINNIQVLQTGGITVTMNTFPSTPIGTILNPVAWITPDSTDIFPINNYSTIAHLVRGSFDPNEKEVSNSDAYGFLNDSSTLTYTVHFQNTGTDTAFNIIIRDTLSNKLDISTFKLVSSSGQVQFHFQNPNILEFVFQNILLPDSNINERASHGFVKYSIRPLSGLINGDSILNKAHIYFDFNSPIVTNNVNSPIYNCTSIMTSQQINLCEHDSILIGSQWHSQPGIYTDTLSYASGCDSLVTSAISIIQSDSTVSVNNATITSNLTGGVYQWFDCNTGQLIPGATNQYFTATVTGNYSVLATSTNGCSTMSPCTQIIINGIDEIKGSLAIYPNPAADHITISSPLKGKLTITNMLGQKVYSSVKQMTESTIKLDIPTGIYFLELKGKEVNVVRKIVKE